MVSAILQARAVAAVAVRALMVAVLLALPAVLAVQEQHLLLLEVR
jgi:hypothetical protein